MDRPSFKSTCKAALWLLFILSLSLRSALPQATCTGCNEPACKKYTKAVADLTDADTEQDLVLFILPPRGKVTGLETKPSTAFSGGGLSAMTVSVGEDVTPLPAAYASAFDVFQAVGNTVFLDSDGFKSPTAVASDVIARFTSTGANMSAVTAGSVDFRVCWVVLPL